MFDDFCVIVKMLFATCLMMAMMIVNQATVLAQYPPTSDDDAVMKLMMRTRMPTASPVSKKPPSGIVSKSELNVN